MVCLHHQLTLRKGDENMTVHQADLHEAKAHLPDLIEAATKGDEVLITKDDRPVATLVSVEFIRPVLNLVLRLMHMQ